jgi:2-isopropylmalate synthase
MGLSFRNNVLPFRTNIDTRKTAHASRVVSSASGFVIQPNKAIVGSNAFANKSTIYPDGFLNNAEINQIMTPESVGLSASTEGADPNADRSAFNEKLIQLGYANVSDDDLSQAFASFKRLTEKKAVVVDDDIRALIDEQLRQNQAIRLNSLTVSCGSKGPQVADVELSIDGSAHTSRASGMGSVDATFNAVNELVSHDSVLKHYEIHAVTEGTDAQAHVTVRLEESGRTVVGNGSDVDTLVASCRAYVDALNRLSVKRHRTAPNAHDI